MWQDSSPTCKALLVFLAVVGAAEPDSWDVQPGMSSRELQLLRFLHAATEFDSKPASTWPTVWEQNGLQDEKQTSQTALRYSLAFTAYAVAVQSYVYTPAYFEPAAKILNNSFRRLILPEVWAFWNKPGTCGLPWTFRCRLQNKSMSIIQSSMYPWQPHAALDDPVGSANIMYSAHLALVGLLYEAFSGDHSLREAGAWSFGPHRYQIDELMEVIQENALANEKMGFGVTCEPGSVFPACNGHLHAALRLYAALRGSQQKTENLTQGWLSWAYEQGRVIEQKPKAPLKNGAFLKILRMKRNQQGLVQERNFIPGCASHDGWTLAYVRSYMEDHDILVRGFEVLSQHHGWRNDSQTGGEFLHTTCFGQGDWTTPLSTSFFPLVYSQLPAEIKNATGWMESARSRVQAALKFIEAWGVNATFGSAGEVEQFFYNAPAGMAIQATANMVMTYAMMQSGSDSVLHDLMGGKGLRLPGHCQPYLSSGAWPAVQVPAAYFQAEDSSLRLRLQASTFVGALHLDVQTCGLAVQRVLQNSVPLDSWEIKDTSLHIGVQVSGDVSVIVLFSPPELPFSFF
eukprot:TRINITY_DN43585_c0_g1_i1.p1 TRINITY_DN43585_c0_g1~~TRINITY_DN43585_c0_g1_i1.p1  ORF type:complete len:571 (-),score=98.80 TRINITY_DN43585_c0_g1_i1:10-1722(-)